MKTLLITLLLILYTTTTTFYGKVVGVSDGDTITVLTTGNIQMKIRLDGIDCPEKKQDFGDRAKQTTSNLCFGKNVKIVSTKTDRYGRTLGYVYVDGKCVNEELLKLGLAWHYKQYNKDKKLSDLEIKARKNKIGIWSMKNPTPPWEYRKSKKKPK